MWLVEDQACAHSKETQSVPLDHWRMIQHSCRVLSYLMESRITYPAAFQHTVWLPNDTIGREDISLLAAPTCDTGLMEVLTMFSDTSLHVHSGEIGGSFPSQLFAFIESSFVDWCSRIFILKRDGKQREKCTENVSWGGSALHVSPHLLLKWQPIISSRFLEWTVILFPPWVRSQIVMFPGAFFSVSGHNL